MATCFDTLVGLSSRDCDCFSDGRPAGGATGATLNEWKYQTFEAGASPSNPLILNTTFTLPDTFSADNIQVFENGIALTLTTDFSRGSANTISVSTPPTNATYQVWYLAEVSQVSFTPAYNKSKSGLHISQLLPEEDVTGLVDCDKTVWDVFTEARTIAIKDLTASLNAQILRRHVERRRTFSGFIGTPDPEGTLSSTKTYAGVRIRTNPVRSGYLRINRIMSLFSATGVVPITVYDGEGTVMTPTFNINTQANKKVMTEVGLTLPLLGGFNTAQDYFVVFEVDPDNLPKLNKVYCPSCNGQKAITTVSDFGYQTEWQTNYQRALGWNNWVIAGGWEGDSVSDFSGAPDNVGGYMNGLALEVEVGCDLSAGLCALAEGTGPETEAAARFIQRRAASYLVSRRAVSSEPNRANFVNRESLAQQADIWEAEAAEAIAYLTQNMKDTFNDCVACKPRMSLGAILT